MQNREQQRPAPTDAPRAARHTARLRDLLAGAENVTPVAVTLDDTDDDDVVAQRVLGDQHVLLGAFDAHWGAQGSRTATLLGTLHLQPVTHDLDDPFARRLRGHLHLRPRMRRIAVALDLDPWETYGVVLSLRPMHNVVDDPSRPTARLWAATGHRLLDTMRLALEDAVQHRAVQAR